MSEIGAPGNGRPADALALDVKNLSKSYLLGEHLNLKKTVSTFTRRIRRRPQDDTTLEALHGVNFELELGQSLGIMGENGSGKSTLLDIVSGIILPDTGYVKVRGVVLPLLEIGAGFHAELTGRENIEVLGTVLGVPRTEIVELTPEIAAFADIDKHLDTPLKRFSSGMRARLSFAVAMRFPADIYIFDEVLAVVDDAFRYRCLAEIEGLKRAGRTVLFVSHDLETARSICDEALWLDSGRVVAHGDIDEISQAYDAAEKAHARSEL